MDAVRTEPAVYREGAAFLDKTPVALRCQAPWKACVMLRQTKPSRMLK